MSGSAQGLTLLNLSALRAHGTHADTFSGTASGMAAEWVARLRAEYTRTVQTNAVDVVKRSAVVGLRAAMETQRLKAIAELTAFKRLVRQAEVDHYALLACYRHIVADSNRSILQSLLLREVLYYQPSLDACEVLLLLRRIRATGAAEWPPLGVVSDRHVR